MNQQQIGGDFFEFHFIVYLVKNQSLSAVFMKNLHYAVTS